ncbi:glycosyltransferase [Calycomorphotria hydatis]|uniref:Teichuronic acid biosynthesis glycosyltransferase TuaH n=1 Tax=Calycomorphotria hydatis TaxID=2528027 RepID=A0A517T4K4_9PLAN|nr:glycosyltransferase [Calycomorphotria hydatis]QDT63299.1 Putative teichuronic acid biosynthesis glycosyltransferase TuaH [Calycomorphotria hydatis]
MPAVPAQAISAEFMPNQHDASNAEEASPKVPQATWCVFADDWGRHPSSCQYLMRELLDRHDVHWINTIGTRLPRLDWTTLQRVGSKLKQWIKTPSEMVVDAESNSPTVHSPFMLPSFRNNWSRQFNRQRLEHTIHQCVESTSGERVAVTTIPLVADLVGQVPIDRWVYYCVDDFSVWPGLDGELLQQMEAELIPKADRVIAASEALQNRLQSTRPDVDLLTHGVDLAQWQLTETPPCPAALRELPKPILLFWGLIDPRMDVDVLRRLSEMDEVSSLVLVGPQQNPPAAITHLPKLHLLPPVSPGELPAWGHAADVLIMPYADLPVTRAMQPLKLLEYLACPKSVVTTALPAVSEWENALDVATTPEQFCELVRQRLQTGLTLQQQSERNRLREESWSTKSRKFESLILGKRDEVIA